MPKQIQFDHRHYVPILKTKGGELNALRSLSVHQTQAITPVFEVHAGQIANPIPNARPKKVARPVALQAAAVFRKLAEVPVARKPFFLDTIWLHSDNPAGSPEAVAATFRAARTAGLNPIPVVRASYGQPTLRQLRREIEAGCGECMFRVRPLDLYRPVPPIGSMLTAVGLSPPSVHFLLDYGQVPMNLASDLPLIPTIADWRSLSAAAGAFPKSLKDLPKLSWQHLSRTDWTGWKAGLASSRETRHPTYSDYACRFPGESPDGGRAGVNLRYACGDEWLVQTGGLVSDGASSEMSTIHQRLISNPAFCGAAHCDGDSQYAWRLPTNEKPGNPQQWVQWSVNHHLVYALEQLASHSWP